MVQLLTKSLRRVGDPVQSLRLFTRAWDECVELQTSPKDEWVGRSLLTLQQIERYEIILLRGSHEVGGLVLAHDPWDAHVGPCMSVFAQYVLPEHRNTGVSALCMRASLRIAKDAGAPVLAFTHRKGPWRYETIYRRISHEKGQGR